MRLNIFSLLIGFIFVVQPVSAQQNTVFNEWFQDTTSAIPMKLETSFRDIINKKDKEEYYPARLTYTDYQGKERTYELAVRARGNARKTACFFPPLKLKFSKTALTQAGLIPFHEIKIANACRVGTSNEEYLFKEYLAYQFYQILSPYSFRVRLAKINYIDTGRKAQNTELYAIIIEPEVELCARLEAMPVERDLTRGAFLERDLLGQMEVFQYMIGNTDWNIGNRHNLITIKVPERPKLVPVPYDFDYSGLAATDYSLPNEVLPIKNVRERFHKGERIEEEYLEPLRLRFLELQPGFLEACAGIERLSPPASREAASYLQSFFKLLDSPKWMKGEFGEK